MSAPDPIQAAAMECVKECAKKMAAVFGYPSDHASYGHVYSMAETVIATSMRELVAREQSDNVILKREIENWRNICEDKITEIFKLSELVKHLEETGEAEAAIDADEKKRLRERVAELEEDVLTWAESSSKFSDRYHEVKEQLAAARRDSERLDWLEDHGWITGDGCSRSAIDATMQREDGK